MAQISPVSSKATSSRIGALKPASGSVRKVSGEKSSTGTKAVEKSVKNPDGKPDSEEASSSSETDSKKDDAGEIAKAEKQIAEKLGRELSDKEKKAIVTKAVENSGKLSEQDVKDLTKNFSWAEQGAKDLGSNTTQSSNPEKITNQLGIENKSQGGSGNDSNGGNSGGNSNQGGQGDNQGGAKGAVDDLKNNNQKVPNQNTGDSPGSGDKEPSRFNQVNKLEGNSAKDAARNFNQNEAPGKGETSPQTQGLPGGGINGQGGGGPSINMSQMQMQQQSQGISTPPSQPFSQPQVPETPPELPDINFRNSDDRE